MRKIDGDKLVNWLDNNRETVPGMDDSEFGYIAAIEDGIFDADY